MQLHCFFISTYFFAFVEGTVLIFANLAFRHLILRLELTVYDCEATTASTNKYINDRWAQGQESVMDDVSHYVAVGRSDHETAHGPGITYNR